MENLVFFHVGGNISLVAHKITPCFTSWVLMPIKNVHWQRYNQHQLLQVLTALGRLSQGSGMSPSPRHAWFLPPPIPSRGKETAGGPAPLPLLPVILLAFNSQIFTCPFCLLPGKAETFESKADCVQPAYTCVALTLWNNYHSCKWARCSAAPGKVFQRCSGSSRCQHSGMLTSIALWSSLGNT